MRESRFADLARAHRELDELLLSHQSALVERDSDGAARLLDEFGAALRRHIRDEEDLLFPALPRAPEIEGASRSILLAEHEKVLALLEPLASRVAGLGPREAGRGRRVVVLIHEEGTLLRLLQHHETREESLVFPALDERVDAAERARVLARCWIPG